LLLLAGFGGQDFNQADSIAGLFQRIAISLHRGATIGQFAAGIFLADPIRVGMHHQRLVAAAAANKKVVVLVAHIAKCSLGQCLRIVVGQGARLRLLVIVIGNAGGHL